MMTARSRVYEHELLSTSINYTTMEFPGDTMESADVKVIMMRKSGYCKLIKLNWIKLVQSR